MIQYFHHYDTVLPVNQDATIIKIIRYEYDTDRMERDRSGRKVPINAKRAVLYLDDNSNPHWHYFRDFEILDAAKMPAISGIEIMQRQSFDNRIDKMTLDIKRWLTETGMSAESRQKPTELEAPRKKWWRR